MSKQEIMSFEQAMQRLEEIAACMEEQALPLEKLLTLYAEGTALAAQCNKKLDDAQAQFESLRPGVEGTDEADL